MEKILVELEELRDKGDYTTLETRLRQINQESMKNKKLEVRIAYLELYAKSIHGNYSKLLRDLDEVWKVAQEIRDAKSAIDIHILKAECYWRLNDLINAYNELDLAEALLEFCFDDTIKQIREFEIELRRGACLALELLPHQAIELYQQLIKKIERAGYIGLKVYPLAINNLGRLYQVIGDYKKSLEMNFQALKIRKERNDSYGIALALDNIGVDFYYRGDYPKAITYLLEAYKEKEKQNMRYSLANTELNLAKSYIGMKEFELAKRYIIHAERVFTTENTGIGLIDVQKTWFLFYYEQRDYENARKVFHRFTRTLETSGKRYQEISFPLHSLMKTKLLMIEERPSKKFLIQQIIDSVVSLPYVNYDVRIELLFMKTNLLLYEYSISPLPEILHEVKAILDSLRTLSEKTGAIRYLAQTYVLRGKIEGLSGNYTLMDQNFIRGMHVAESYGLIRLAVMISNEYDEFLNKIQPTRYPEAMRRLSNEEVDELIEETFYQKYNEFNREKREEGEGCLLLITNAIGSRVYSYVFDNDCLKIDEDLISSVFSTIQMFISEAFHGEGHVRRIIHEDYYFLIHVIQSINFIYVVKDSTYLASKKLKEFSERVMKDPAIAEEIKRNKELFTVQVSPKAMQRMDEYCHMIFKNGDEKRVVHNDEANKV